MKIYGQPEEKVRQAVISGDITIAVYGLWKMGVPLAAVFADAGARVIGVGIDEGVADGINRGICHVTGETGLSELVEQNVCEGRLSATSDLVYATEVFAYDPVPRGEMQRFGAIPSDLGSGAGINGIDAIRIASDHAGFKEIDWDLLDRRMRHKVVVAARGILALEELRLRRYHWAVGQS